MLELEGFSFNRCLDFDYELTGTIIFKARILTLLREIYVTYKGFLTRN